MTLRKILFAFLAGFMLAPVAQAEEGRITIELNRTEQVEKACRLTFLMENGLEKDVSLLGMEIAVITKKELVTGLVLLRSGLLPAGKERVKQFDLPNTECDLVSRLLINQVVECEGEGLSAAMCSPLVAASSRSDIGLE